jgi:hypothetical protein
MVKPIVSTLRKESAEDSISKAVNQDSVEAKIFKNINFPFV